MNVSPEFNSHTLSNGIRVVHKFDDSNVAYCGLIINAGSRDELDDEQGMAHFIEHVIFKGTTKRSAYFINSCLDDVGGDINAYTTKEETCVYSVFLNQYYARAIELTADIVFNSIFPEKEIEKEKKVIIDEINSYKDSPADLIFDDFEELVFSNQPLGRNILGTPKQLKRYGKTEVERFIKRNYCTDQMVIASVGKIDFQKLIKLIEKNFGTIPENKRTTQRIYIPNYAPINKTVSKKTYQKHCILGNTAYNFKDPKRVGLSLLNNILAGSSLNSKLTLALREKHGYAYNIESNYSAYSDTGVVSIYFGTDKDNFDKCIELIQKELLKLRNQKFGTLQLSRAKKQIIGQMAISSENKENLVLALGKSFLHFNRFDSLDDITQKVLKITEQDLLEISNEILDWEKFSMLIYQ